MGYSHPSAAGPAMQERDIFIAALQIEDPEQRAAHLTAACANDAPLRARVEELLAAHERQESFFLDSPPVALADLPSSDASIHQPLGSQIGPYKLLQMIGEGGMGL